MAPAVVLPEASPLVRWELAPSSPVARLWSRRFHRPQGPFIRSPNFGAREGTTFMEIPYELKGTAV